VARCEVIATTIYGIPNCDNVRSARAWLEDHAVELLEQWCDEAQWTALLNHQATTWRQLAPDVTARVQDRSSAIRLMLEHPTLIRRPLLRHGADLIIGFDADRYSSLVAQ
jgi:arsenate reductase